MKVTKMLMQEHQIILSKLNELEATCETKIDREKVTSLLHFFQNFADEFHHKKEENILFEWMRQMNPMVDHGPLACMLKEHDQGRALVREASDLLETNASDEDLKVPLMNFISVLRDHISKEDNVLYNIAKQLEPHPGAGDEAMLADFLAVNKQEEMKAQKFVSNLEWQKCTMENLL